MDKKFDDSIFGQLVQPIKTQCCFTKQSNLYKTANLMPNQQHQLGNQPESTKNQNCFNKKFSGSDKAKKGGCSKDQNQCYQQQLSTSSTEIGGSAGAKLGKPCLKLEKNNKQENYRCPLCQVNKKGRYCMLCKGTGEISANDNLVKFIQYLVQFKLGERGIYKPSEPKLIPTKSQKMTKSVYETPKIFQRKSLPYYNLRSSLTNKVHKDIGCDKCGMFPIIGPRYHCSQPICKDDYDLCQNCYCEYDHQHDMEQINQTQIEKRMRLLSCQLRKGLDGNRNRIFSSSIY